MFSTPPALRFDTVISTNALNLKVNPTLDHNGSPECSVVQVVPLLSDCNDPGPVVGVVLIRSTFAERGHKKIDVIIFYWPLIRVRCNVVQINNSQTKP